LSQCHRGVLFSHSQYKSGGKALHTIRKTRRCHTPTWRRAQNAVCLNGAGHDGDGPNAASSDASNHNFRTLMIGGRWSAFLASVLTCERNCTPYVEQLAAEGRAGDLHPRRRADHQLGTAGGAFTSPSCCGAWEGQPATWVTSRNAAFRGSGPPEKVFNEFWKPSRGRLGPRRGRKLLDDHKAVDLSLQVDVEGRVVAEGQRIRSTGRWDRRSMPSGSMLSPAA
jgi:hypothetical protein